jgi:hypothetical protein
MASNTTHTYRLADVTITPAGPEFPGCFSVHPVWDGVDRRDTGGMLVRGRPLADRLAAAIRAGAAFVPRGVNTDTAGRTYVDTDSRVLARMLNADLRRLGF